MDVEIVYCDACGGLGMAVEVRERLAEACGDAVDSVETTPLDDGSFAVRVDGEEVFSTDHAPYDPDDVADTVCEAAD